MTKKKKKKTTRFSVFQYMLASLDQKVPTSIKLLQQTQPKESIPCVHSLI